MKKYSREMIAQVLAASDIVDVIGACIELKPAGTNQYKALSPFSNEKTPSFHVSRDRQLFHCFSSDRGGDAISFLMEYEGLSFNEAVTKLADRAGIRLQTTGVEDNREDYLRRRVLELNEFAAKFYRRCLANPDSGATGRAYLQKRQLKETTETRFGLGMAPDDWSRFHDAAVKQQFRDGELMASGLVRRGERAIYDFFRNRIIVPIKDVSGNVVAFGGRDLGDSPAKYINSPETSAYKKSRVLYGLCEARDAMRREKYVILVEGYFDLMRCFDAGIENVVATCGTALTEQQAMLIKRYVPRVVVIYDGDAAGIRAAMKGISILTAAGLTVQAMAPPDGQDPDDFIRSAGADEFRARVARADDFVSFIIKMSVDRRKTVEGRTEIANEIFEIIRGNDEVIRVEQYLQQVADGLGVHLWDCKRAFEKFCRGRRRPGTASPIAAEKDSRAYRPLKDDVEFVAALLGYPDLTMTVAHQLAEISVEDTAFLLAERICAGAPFSLHDLSSDEERHLYSAAVNIEIPDSEKAHQLVRERLENFMSSTWEKELQDLQRQTRQATRDEDQARSAELYDRIMELKRRIEDLGMACR